VICPDSCIKGMAAVLMFCMMHFLPGALSWLSKKNVCCLNAVFSHGGTARKKKKGKRNQMHRILSKCEDMQ